MNYFKQGDVANADKIKAAFKAKGINVLGFGFADKTVVYCSIGGCVVQTLPYSINLMNILFSHPDYQELELVVKPKFKVGDWVVRKDGETFYGGNYAEQITLIEVDEIGKCIWLLSKTWVRDDDIRLWTIADAKDGDVLVAPLVKGSEHSEQIFIFKEIKDRAYVKNAVEYYCRCMDNKFATNERGFMGQSEDCFTPASKEQRDILFQKMKESGYEWNEKKKELKKIQPHYDIANFQPFDKVLIRVGNKSKWTCDFFSHYHKGFHCVGCDDWSQCIPFEGNEHLLGTTDMCGDEYINW